MGMMFPQSRKSVSTIVPRLLLGSLVGLFSLAAGDLRAQALSNTEFNVHAAALRENLFEETGNGLAAGARLVRNTRSGLSFGGNFDWVRRGGVDLGPTFVGQEPTLTMLLYSAGIDYVFPSTGRARFFLGAGFGAATTMLDGVGANIAESSTGALIPFGVGVKIYNRPVDPSWAFRIDARDNVIFVNTLTPGASETQTEPRHNLEFSAGLSFVFGSGPRAGAPQPGRTPARPAPARPVPADQDRDGIPDARDGCEDTPPGSAVDEIGCPTALDTDGDGIPDRPIDPDARPVPRDRAADSDADGVPDSQDDCPSTPRGVRIDALGCPVPPRPVPVQPAPAQPAPAQPAPAQPVPAQPGPARPAVANDTDSDGVTDADDRCVNTAAGVSVDGRGCPVVIDADQDGVAGAADRCPNTPLGVAVDARGCPAEGEPPAEDRPGQPPVEEPAADQPPAQPPAAPGIPAGMCVDTREWFPSGAPIRFEERTWQKLGVPEPISVDNLKRVGEVDGVPVFVSAFSTQPYQDLWLPLCVPSGSFQLYVPAP